MLLQLLYAHIQPHCAHIQTHRALDLSEFIPGLAGEGGQDSTGANTGSQTPGTLVTATLSGEGPEEATATMLLAEAAIVGVAGAGEGAGEGGGGEGGGRAPQPRNPADMQVR